MEIYRNPRRFRFEPRAIILCALIIELTAAPLLAQKHGMGSKAPITLLPKGPDDRVVVDNGVTPSSKADAKTCSLQPFPGMSNTASVTSLQVPAKAQKEYEKACEALKNNKLPETEGHLRKATALYPDYVNGWVMLGQVLGTQNQAEKGRDACSKASAADPKYIPAYLCLAEIAGREQKWSDVLKLSSRALELDPVGDAYGYFFSAIAYFNLNQLAVAEERALKAKEIDRDRREPLIRFLLAQIYQAKHDPAEATSNLQEYRELTSASLNGAGGNKSNGTPSPK
jgi:cytochrome c-type biogenesis protein CcmH/NrfG